MHQVPLVFVFQIAEILQETSELASVHNFLHDLDSFFESLQVTSPDASVHFKINGCRSAFDLLSVLCIVTGG